MSGRIRTIKPEILEDGTTAGLTETAFRIFIGAIAIADDYGNFRAEARFLEGQIFWKRPSTIPIDDALTELAPLVDFYTVRGQRYGAIRTWAKHQKVSHPGKPRVPGPSEKDGEPPESLPKSSGGSPEGLLPDLRPPTSDQRPTTTTAPALPEVEKKGPGGLGLELDYYAYGITDGTGLPCVVNKQYDPPKLLRAIEAHAPKFETTTERLAWVRTTAKAYANATKARPVFQRGYSVDKFAEWLNAGRPVAEAAVAAVAASRSESRKPLTNSTWRRPAEVEEQEAAQVEAAARRARASS